MVMMLMLMLLLLLRGVAGRDRWLKIFIDYSWVEFVFLNIMSFFARKIALCSQTLVYGFWLG